jgi:hypothetical protein
LQLADRPTKAPGLVKHAKEPENDEKGWPAHKEPE